MNYLSKESIDIDVTIENSVKCHFYQAKAKRSFPDSRISQIESVSTESRRMHVVLDLRAPALTVSLPKNIGHLLP